MMTQRVGEIRSGEHVRAQLEGKGEGVGGKTEFHVAKQQIFEGKGSLGWRETGKLRSVCGR